MSPSSLKKFDKLAWVARLYFYFNPFEAKIHRDAFAVSEGGEKKDIVFYFPFQLVQVDAEPPRMGMIEDRNDENPDDRMILLEESAAHVAFSIPSVIKMYPPTFLGTSINPWALPGLSYVAADNLKHFLENIEGVTVTADARLQIFDLFGRAFERIAMLYELVETASAENMDAQVRVVNRAAKDFYVGLNVNRVGFSYLKFIHALEDGSLLDEYKFFGLSPDLLPARELTRNDLDNLSGQSSGLVQLEVVRDDLQGGKVEFLVITGWKDKYPVVMMPKGELLPSWASQPISGVTSVLFYPEGAHSIKFTDEETHYFETLETAAKLSQRQPRATAFPMGSSNYVLAVNLEEQGVESWLISSENERVDKSHVRLPWGGRFAATAENVLQLALWAARLSLYRARDKEARAVRAKEVLKLGVAGSLSYLGNAEMQKLPQLLQEALTNDQPPNVLRQATESLAQSVAV